MAVTRRHVCGHHCHVLGAPTLHTPGTYLITTAPPVALRRAQTAVQRPLAPRHALECSREGSLLGHREWGKPQASVGEEVAETVVIMDSHK